MQRITQATRSSDPRQRAPPVVVSLGVFIVFVAVVTLALAAVTAPWLVGAFGTGLLTALAAHVVRTRLAGRRDSERPPAEPNGRAV